MDAFLRHFVGLRVTVTKADAEPMTDTYSAFVMSVGDDWYLVTAGHCIDELNDALSHGYALQCELADGLARRAPYKRSIPFRYDPTHAVSTDRRDFGDFGVIELSELYRRQLTANGIVPIDERRWVPRPKRFKPFHYLLLGLPRELTRQFGHTVHYHPVVCPIRKLARRPRHIPAPSVPTFYGRLVHGGDLRLQSIKGMSGGPIFALSEIGGRVDYWVHAIQSRCTNVVVAPLVETLAALLLTAQAQAARTDSRINVSNAGAEPRAR